MACASLVPWVVSLIPSDQVETEMEMFRGHEISLQIGTHFAKRRRILMSPLGIPCVPPPWGTLAAIYLRTGDIRWQVPHGSVRDLVHAFVAAFRLLV